ncbi:MAG: DUF3365 domain-containing protein [Methylophaga sp.]|nr:DUF3365 domain-containing protein [Methylophaga sp.]
MKNAFFICLLPLNILACSSSTSNEMPAFEQQALAATGEFAGELKQALQAAMQEGGPTMAVAVCQSKAPQIAAELSAETGFDISRTSLKVRNPGNQAEPWQQAVLNDFEQQKQAGKPINELIFVGISDDGETLRMMKAIGTEPVCLTCHGKNIDASLQAEINRLYPTDQATGFQQGDIRGAFSVVKYLND